jgi:cell division protein FtsL
VSVPAERLPAPRHVADSPIRAPRPRSGAAPAPTPPVARTVSTARAARAHAQRRARPAFWAMTAAVLTALVVALVSVSALVVETGFGIDRAEARIAQLLEEGERLRMDVAAMSAPNRVATWARSRGLVMPEEVVVLQVPNETPDSSSAANGDEAA